MENITDKSIFEFGIDEEGKSHLSGIARWTNLNAITGLIAIGVSLISTVSALSRMGRYGGPAMGFSFFILLVQLVISLLLNITLINAASNIKKGVEMSNQSFFGIGLTKLATYFKIVGILTIIILVIVVLIFLIGIAAGIGRGY